MNKKLLIKFLLLIGLSIFLIDEVVYTYKNSDPWGLTFAIATIPCAILCIISIYNAIKTFKLLIKNDKEINNEKHKLIFLFPIIIILILALLVTGITMYRFYNTNTDDDIPGNYIAVFYGGSGEKTYSTYIYKVDNGHESYGFNYINTTNTTTSWGSSDWDIQVTSKGNVHWMNDVFRIAKENNAYSYVKLPNRKTSYTIEEFADIFMKN